MILTAVDSPNVVQIYEGDSALKSAEISPAYKVHDMSWSNDVGSDCKNDFHGSVIENNEHGLFDIRRPCLALAKAGRRLGPPWVWSSAPSKPSHPSLHGSVPALCSNVFLRHCLSGTAASSGFSSFHSGHCSVEWLFQLPQWPPARSFSGTVSQALQPPHPPAALLAFRPARLCPCTLLQCLSQALSLRHCSVHWLF